MATEFVKLERREGNTRFTHRVLSQGGVKYAVEEYGTGVPEHPADYQKVIHVGEDTEYGDVFIAYPRSEVYSENTFIIFFGVAGHEFD